MLQLKQPVVLLDVLHALIYSCASPDLRCCIAAAAAAATVGDSELIALQTSMPRYRVL
jgi:hypothetical protein